MIDGLQGSESEREEETRKQCVFSCLSDTHVLLFIDFLLCNGLVKEPASVGIDG